MIRNLWSVFDKLWPEVTERWILDDVLAGGCWKYMVDWLLFVNLDLSVMWRSVGSSGRRTDRSGTKRKIGWGKRTGQETRIEKCCAVNGDRGLNGLVWVVELLAGWSVLSLYLWQLYPLLRRGRAVGRGDDNEFWWCRCKQVGLWKWWCVESSELELQHLIGGCGRRVYLLVLRKLICSGYECVKRHRRLQWAVLNVLVFRGNRLFELIGGLLGCGMQFEITKNDLILNSTPENRLTDGRMSGCMLKSRTDG